MKWLVSVIILLIIAACANKGRLPGGPPDKIPPFVIESNPVRDTVNIGSQRRFRFVFNEMVNRNSLEQFTYLLPLGNDPLGFYWNGYDEVEIEIPDSLPENRTFMLVIGKGFLDLHQVPSAADITRAFTISGELDRGSIRGRFIVPGAAYKNWRLALFSNGFQQSPDYVTDIRADGQFTLNRIQVGTYTPVIFVDDDRNFRPNLGSEKLSIPMKRLTVDTGRIFNQPLRMTHTDTTAPFLQILDTVSLGILRLTFDEEIDIANSQLTITDSAGRHQANVYLFRQGSQAYHAVMKPILTDTIPYRLNAQRLSDRFGNSKDSLSGEFEFFAPAAKDTSAFQITAITPAKNGLVNTLTPTLDIRLNQQTDPIELPSIFLLKNGDTVAGVQFQAGINRLIAISPPLNVEAIFEWRVDLAGILSVYGENVGDTVMLRNITTPAKNKFGTVEFTVRTLKYDSLRVVFEKLTDQGRVSITTERQISTNQTVRIDPFEAGRYTYWFYADQNKNKQYDGARLKPLSTSEPVMYPMDTVTIRANWERVLRTVEWDAQFR